jgi:hypothetical protein
MDGLTVGVVEIDKMGTDIFQAAKQSGLVNGSQKATRASSH